MLRSLIALGLVALTACSDDYQSPPAGDVGDTDTADGDVAPSDTLPTDTLPTDTQPSDTQPADTSPDIVPDTAPDVVQQPALVLVVSVPADTPAEDGIFVSGNQPELGDWDGHGVALTRMADGRWTTTLSFPLGTALEFKITRGSWDTVEKNATGGEIDNRTHTVAALEETLEITVETWRDRPPIPPGPGDLDFIRGVSSAYLDEDRDVVIYLPPGYDGSTARYPVLYMHDGQNLMDPATSAFGVAWEVDDTADQLINDGLITPIIIVGVYNTSARIDEYTPVPDGDNGGGLADAYGRFLAEELKPTIDATYRTQPEAGVTGLAGSSLGGLVSMYLGLERSETFTRLGVVSPSVWWANRWIVGRVDQLPGKLPLRIWLDIGTDEGGSETVADAQALRDALVAKGWVLGQDLIYTEYPGAQHNEASWAARTDDILEALYPK